MRQRDGEAFRVSQAMSTEKACHNTGEFFGNLPKSVSVKPECLLRLIDLHIVEGIALKKIVVIGAAEAIETTVETG